jgi:hypothetical protein
MLITGYWVRVTEDMNSLLRLLTRMMLKILSVLGISNNSCLSVSLLNRINNLLNLSLILPPIDVSSNHPLQGLVGLLMAVPDIPRVSHSLRMSP